MRYILYPCENDFSCTAYGLFLFLHSIARSLTQKLLLLQQNLLHRKRTIILRALKPSNNWKFVLYDDDDTQLYF